MRLLFPLYPYNQIFIVSSSPHQLNDMLIFSFFFYPLNHMQVVRNVSFLINQISHVTLNIHRTKYSYFPLLSHAVYISSSYSTWLSWTVLLVMLSNFPIAILLDLGSYITYVVQLPVVILLDLDKHISHVV